MVLGIGRETRGVQAWECEFFRDFAGMPMGALLDGH